MTKRQKQNHRIPLAHKRFPLALFNKTPVRYEILMDATDKKNPIHVGQDGYETATYEVRLLS